MGKKGNKRKTRWRVLSIGGEDCGGSLSANEDEGDAERDSASPGNGAASYARAANSQRMPRSNGKTRGYQQSYYKNRSYSSQENGHHHQPLVTTEKKTFNEEEYTKITTPRQDVLFKKGYLGRKRPTPAPADTAVSSTAPSTPADVANGNLHADGSVVQNGDIVDNDHIPYEALSPEDPQQFVYTNGYVDPNGLYYINGSGYELYDPYSGNVTVVVGPAPHFPGPGGGPPVLAAVPCQPLPLQPLEWFNPAFVPYVASPCLGKTYSTDSQNCSPQSSESTGPPGSPQDCDEVMETTVYQQPAMIPPPPPPAVAPTQPPAYVYPGYMFGAPVYNMNGVTVQGATPQPLLTDVGATKKRKKKRRRRRRRAGLEECSEESSSDEKDLEEPASVTSQESSSQELAEVNLNFTSPEHVPAESKPCSNFNSPPPFLIKQEPSEISLKQLCKEEPIPFSVTSQVESSQPELEEPVSPPKESYASKLNAVLDNPVSEPKETFPISPKEILFSSSTKQDFAPLPAQTELVFSTDLESTVPTVSQQKVDPVNVKQPCPTPSFDVESKVKVNGFPEITSVDSSSQTENKVQVIVNGYHSDSSSNKDSKNNSPPLISNLNDSRKKKQKKNANHIICNGDIKHAGKLQKTTKQKNVENKSNLNFKMDRNGHRRDKEKKGEEQGSNRGPRKSPGNDSHSVPYTAHPSTKKQDSGKLPTLSLRPEKSSVPKDAIPTEIPKTLPVHYTPTVEESLLKSLTGNTSKQTKDNVKTSSNAFMSDSSRSKPSSLSPPGSREKEDTEYFISEERQQKSDNSCHRVQVDDDDDDDEDKYKPPTPVPPPRRKKLKCSSKRLSSERAPTPGRELVESSSSTSSKESEESVIELLPNTSPGLEDKLFEEDNYDDDDDDVIFRTGSTATIIEKPFVPSITAIENFANEISSSLIKEIIVEVGKDKLSSFRPITEAVTKWLHSQSPEEVLSLPPTECSDVESLLEEEEEGEEEEDDEVESQTDQKNVHRNPLPASFHKNEAGRRVAETIGCLKDDLKPEKDMKIDNLTTCEGEWDHYDCKSLSATTTLTEESLDERRSIMCDPSLFVAKYYRLGPAVDRISASIQVMDTSDLDSDLEELDALKHFQHEMETEGLMKIPVINLADGESMSEIEKEKKYDSGVHSEESGDEFLSEANLGQKTTISNILQHQSEILVNQLKGDGPFPCGICCIIQ